MNCQVTLDVSMVNLLFTISCLLGLDNWGIPGEDGAKGEVGDPGIPNTEIGFPGAHGLKGSIGDGGGSLNAIF